MTTQSETIVDFFRKVAHASAEATLPLVRRDFSTQNKQSGGFDPVTDADRACERAIRALLEAHFPDDAIIGEEYGTRAGQSGRHWVIDPIDGTRSFISGIPLWGTLLGRTGTDGRADCGMMAQPFTGELFCAAGGQAFWERGDERRPLQVRSCENIEEATLFYTSIETFEAAGMAGAIRSLQAKARLTRLGADCYAPAMLAAGQVDLVVEAGLQNYDIVALIPIIEAAGGVVERFDGGRAEAGGDVIMASSPALLEAARAILTGPA